MARCTTSTEEKLISVRTFPSGFTALYHFNVNNDFVAESSAAILDDDIQNVVVSLTVVQFLCIVQYSWKPYKIIIYTRQIMNNK